MRKNQHRFNLPVSSGPRYRFTWPEDTRKVKLCAFAQGIHNAHAQKAQQLELTEQGVQAAAIEAALLTEKEVHRGFQGCNQPVLFRETFADMCAAIHTALLVYWEEDPAIYQAFHQMPGSQQIAQAALTAERFLDQIEHMRAHNQPIVFAR